VIRSRPRAHHWDVTLEEAETAAAAQAPEVVQGRRSKARLEAFSDGVFAIAITLLVLEIKVPALTDLQSGGLAGALLRQWPSYTAYLLSFGTILIMWVNHHVLMDYVRHVDHGFLYLNGLLLMTITLVPFPTAVLAQYANQRSSYVQDQHVAAALYCGLLVMVAIAFNLVWWYAARGSRLIDSGVAGGQQSVSRRYVFGPLLYLVAVVVAFFSAPAAILICIGMAVFFAWPYRPPRTA
jgi:uncharacterized membrane protein